MIYIVVGAFILIGVFFFRTSEEAKRRESYTEPRNVDDIVEQLSMTTKLYLVDSFTQLVGDDYGNLNKPGFNASIKMSGILGITPDIMKKYKYVNSSENSMSKTLFLLKNGNGTI